MFIKRILLSLLALIGLAAASYSQERVDPANSRMNTLQSTTQAVAGVTGMKARIPNSALDKAAGSTTLSSDYELGPGDLLTLSEVNLDDTTMYADKTFRVDNSGDVTFPLAGRVHVAGLTTVGVEQQVDQLLAKVVKDPHAVVGIAEFHSQPISVLGAVNTPGLIQIFGAKNLFEVLSLAGGLRPDAGNSIIITRSAKSGSIPLPDAKPDSTGRFSVASVKVKAIMSATDPAQNILVMPEDVVTVPKGEVVYAVGALTKPGGFLLGESGTLSALQVISLAEGLLKTSSPDKAEILRVVPGAPGRTQIAVNVKQLLKGKAPDVPLQPDDILFIPNSNAKGFAYQSANAAISLVSGLAIYGKF